MKKDRIEKSYCCLAAMAGGNGFVYDIVMDSGRYRRQMCRCVMLPMRIWRRVFIIRKKTSRGYGSNGDRRIRGESSDSGPPLLREWSLILQEPRIRSMPGRIF